MSSMEEKVQSLLKKAESNKQIGEIHEAEACLARANKLMEKYKLSMSEVEAAEYLKTETVKDEKIDWKSYGIKATQRRSTWIRLLSSMVAELFSCRILSRKGTNSIWVVGHDTNRKVATQIIGTLVRWASRLADAKQAALRRHKSPMAKGFRKSFLLGFVSAIAHRAQDILEERERQKQQNVDERGLILIDQEVAEVEEFMEEGDFGKDHSKPQAKITNQLGYVSGYKAGQIANIDSVTEELPHE